MNKERIQNFQSLLEQSGFGGAIITPSSNLFYLTGQRTTADRDFSALLISSYDIFWLSVKDFLNSDLLWKKVADYLPPNRPIAVESSIEGHWLLELQNRFPNRRWFSCAPLFSKLRKIKSPEELLIIQKAQHMTETALNLAINWGLEGKTEIQVARFLMDVRLELGFDSVGMGIVASGPNSAFPHHVPGKRVIREGDAVTIDIGGEYHGYHADMTRTFAIGHATHKFRQIYHTVLEAYETARKSVHSGLPCSQIDAAARTVIQEAGYGPYFSHSLGHGIGIDVHEAPFISPSCSDILTPGMVFSNEPGVYIPGEFGVRIEDLMAISRNGQILVLNQFPKELMIL